MGGRAIFVAGILAIALVVAFDAAGTPSREPVEGTWEVSGTWDGRGPYTGTITVSRSGTAEAPYHAMREFVFADGKRLELSGSGTFAGDTLNLKFPLSGTGLLDRLNEVLGEGGAASPPEAMESTHTMGADRASMSGSWRTVGGTSLSGTETLNRTVKITRLDPDTLLKPIAGPIIIMIYGYNLPGEGEVSAEEIRFSDAAIKVKSIDGFGSVGTWVKVTVEVAADVAVGKKDVTVGTIEGKEKLTVTGLEKLPLGKSAKGSSDPAWFRLYVVTDGTLSLRTSKGKLELYGSDRSTKLAESGQGTSIDKYEVAKGKHGAYFVKVTGGTGEFTVSNTFVQEGKVADGKEPWHGSTYWPVNDFGSSETSKSNNMYDDAVASPHGEDQGLVKFDKALSQDPTKSGSATHWEKGGDYRRSFGFEQGHYVKLSSPRESHAEEDWKADLDGDGKIEAGEEGKMDFMDSDDCDGDGETFFDKNNVVIKTKDGKTYAGGTTRSVKMVDVLEEGAAGAEARVVKSLKEADVDSITQNEAGRHVVKAKDGSTYEGSRVDKYKAIEVLKKSTPTASDYDKVTATIKESNVDKKTSGADGDFDDDYSVGWWGHCNAVAVAAIIFQLPEEFESNGMKFKKTDSESILVEYCMGDSDDSWFYWKRGYGGFLEDNEYAQSFHEFLKKWVRDEKAALMGDMTLNKKYGEHQVWNYAVYGYSADMKEAEGGDEMVVDVTCRLASTGSSKTLTYRLHFNSEGLIRTDADSKTDWTTKASGWGENADKGYIRYLVRPRGMTGPGSSGNPDVTLEKIKRVFGERLRYNSES